MKICPRAECHTSVDDNATFCPNCGFDFRKKYYCHYCRIQLKYGDKFCYRCGLEQNPSIPLSSKTVDDAVWKALSSSVQGCKEYLKQNPSGYHAKIASKKIEEHEKEKDEQVKTFFRGLYVLIRYITG